MMTSLPFLLVHPADQYACGNYRVRWPLDVLLRNGLAHGVESSYLLDAGTLADLNPDVVVFQRLIELDQIARLKQYRKESDAFFVFELDDLITNMPGDNRFSGLFPRQTMDRLRQAIGLCDRLVVSTPALAEAYGEFAPDVVVCPNSLPNIPWASLSRHRRHGDRPRVGWAGSTGHLGDFKILYPVVKATTHLVDWVFLAALPNVLRRYAAEVHPLVPIADYPPKLACLDLDLAVAPLEVHHYNDAKSNLRLLELGAMGYPVICSAGVGAFDCDLPVTRVDNRSDAWIDAIVAAITDRDALAGQGDALRQAIHADWLMDGRVDMWAFAWGLTR
ncbi:MAG: glycosyltransferase family protein [Acidithiobacillus sp.]